MKNGTQSQWKHIISLCSCEHKYKVVFLIIILTFLFFLRLIWKPSRGVYEQAGSAINIIGAGLFYYKLLGIVLTNPCAVIDLIGVDTVSNQIVRGVI